MGWLSSKARSCGLSLAPFRGCLDEARATIEHLRRPWCLVLRLTEILSIASCSSRAFAWRPARTHAVRNRIHNQHRLKRNRKFVDSPLEETVSISASLSTMTSLRSLPNDGHASGLGAIHHRPFPMASGEMDSGEFTAFLLSALRNLAAFSVQGSLHYVCMDWRHVPELLAAGGDAYGELKNLCIWVKGRDGLALPQPAGAHLCV